MHRDLKPANVLIGPPTRYIAKVSDFGESRQLKGADGAWDTWIDYDRFHALAASGEPFTVEDYKAPCPPWALLGAAEDGFDPSDTRMYKKKANGKSR